MTTLPAHWSSSTSSTCNSLPGSQWDALLAEQWQKVEAALAAARPAETLQSAGDARSSYKPPAWARDRD
eukprot:15473716-Alexandrium_andersonii.AAC.1